MDNLMKRTETLLREVVDHLERNRNSFGTEVGQEAEASQEGNSEGNRSNSSLTEASVEFRRRFPGMCSSRTTTQFTLPPKRQKMTGYVPAKASFTPKETWTHDFCVLARQDENVTPSRARLHKLLDAGLGKARLSVQKNASHKELSTALENHFPKLKVAGGFEFLRADGGGGGQRQLSLLYPGAFGYTVPHLRERFGQAVAYIRPLQTDLDESPLKQEVGLTPKVDCVNCGLSIPMAMVRNHQQECRGGSSSEVTSAATCTTSSKEPWMVLNEVFPVHDFEQCKQAWESSGGDMSKAVAKLGGWIDEDSLQGDKEQPIIAGFSEEKQNGPEQETICSTDMSAAEIFNSYRDEVVAHQSSTQFISVNRMQISLLMQLMRIYKDPRLDLTKPLNVNFVGEHGADVGGPTKEYFHEAISILSKVDTLYNIQLFGGQEGHLLPLYGVDAISSGCFEMAGKLVAHSVLHGGPGMAGLSPVVIKYLVTGSIDEAKELVSIDDLYDPELQEILQTKFKEETKLKNIDSNLKGKLEDMLVKHGLTDVVPLTDVNKAKAIKDLLIAEVLITRTLALDSFFKGLNVHGLGDLFRKHQGVVSYVLPTKEEAAVDVALFKGKLVFCDEDLNDEEVQTRMWLLQFIEEASRMREESEEKEHGHSLLSSLLLFITGTTIMDSDLKVDVVFQSNPTKPLLEADSCFSKLTVPACHSSYEEFKKACTLSIRNGALGYGRF